MDLASRHKIRLNKRHDSPLHLAMDLISHLDLSFLQTTISCRQPNHIRQPHKYPRPLYACNSSDPPPPGGRPCLFHVTLVITTSFHSPRWPSSTFLHFLPASWLGPYSMKKLLSNLAKIRLTRASFVPPFCSPRFSLHGSISPTSPSSNSLKQSRNTLIPSDPPPLAGRPPGADFHSTSCPSLPLPALEDVAIGQTMLR